MCDSNEDYTRGGYPTRENDESGEMVQDLSKLLPEILRNDCPSSLEETLVITAVLA